MVYDTDDGEAFLKYLKKNGIYSVDIALVDIKVRLYTERSGSDL